MIPFVFKVFYRYLNINLLTYLKRKPVKCIYLIMINLLLFIPISLSINRYKSNQSSIYKSFLNKKKLFLLLKILLIINYKSSIAKLYISVELNFYHQLFSIKAVEKYCKLFKTYNDLKYSFRNKLVDKLLTKTFISTKLNLILHKWNL